MYCSYIVCVLLGTIREVTYYTAASNAWGLSRHIYDKYGRRVGQWQITKLQHDFTIKLT